MTTTSTGLPPTRPFTPEECDALVSAGIVADGEQAAVLSGTRLFNVDECIEMVNVGVLRREDHIELMDGKLVIMAPIGKFHEFATDWFTMLLASALFGRAMVRVQGSIRLHNFSAPEPDVAVLRIRSFDDIRPYYSNDIYFIIEVADSSLRYDSGPKLARYAAAGIPEVWIANLRAREVTVYTTPSGPEYENAATYRPGDSISPGAFPDVALAVNEFMPPATHGRDAETSL